MSGKPFEGTELESLAEKAERTPLLDEYGLFQYTTSIEKGWRVLGATDFDSVTGRYLLPAKLALVHSEVSEALEAFRAGDIENFKEELADIVIRVAVLASGLGIELDRAVLMKLAANRKREYRHGGKRV